MRRCLALPQPIHHHSVYLPQALYKHVQTPGYINVSTLPAADENPVNKVVPLVISGHNKGEVCLDKLGNDGIPENAGWRLANECEQLLALHSQVAGLRRKISGLKETLAEKRIQHQ
jgi:hypothetical protein